MLPAVEQHNESNIVFAHLSIATLIQPAPLGPEFKLVILYCTDRPNPHLSAIVTLFSLELRMYGIGEVWAVGWAPEVSRGLQRSPEVCRGLQRLRGVPGT